MGGVHGVMAEQEGATVQWVGDLSYTIGSNLIPGTP